jgi:hypothetical protein
MDSSSTGGSANSSDFVGLGFAHCLLAALTGLPPGSQAVQVRGDPKRPPRPRRAYLQNNSRMLENPTDESVVRWGNEGDSFVVLEVGPLSIGAIPLPMRRALVDKMAEREVYQAHTA